MQNLFSETTRITQKQRSILFESSQKKILQNQLLEIYELRLKSLMQAINIHQENVMKERQEGRLFSMLSQDLAIYRIDRELQLLKDALLIEKQKLLIRVLTAFHQLKKQFNQLKLQLSINKISHPKPKPQNAAEKDTLSNNEQDKSPDIKIKQKSNANNFQFAIGSNQTGINFTTLSLYEKILQEKLTIIKEMDKKITTLQKESQESQRIIARLNLQKIILQQQNCEQCRTCKELQQIILKLNKEIQTLKTQIQKYSKQLKQKEVSILERDQQINNNLQKIKELDSKLIQSVNNDEINKIQQKKQIKAPYHDNIAVINQLKQKLILQEQQLMYVTNSFQFLREDLTSSLLSEVKRLRSSYAVLKQKCITWLTVIKREMFTSFEEIIETVRLKFQAKNSRDDVCKRLKKIDNELDFFLQQRNLII